MSYFQVVSKQVTDYPVGRHKTLMHIHMALHYTVTADKRTGKLYGRAKSQQTADILPVNALKVHIKTVFFSQKA